MSAPEQGRPLQPVRAGRARAIGHAVFLIAIILAGLFAFLQLGRAEDPGFTIKVMTWSAWPGATAQEDAGPGGRAAGKALAGTAVV
jgi:hypothetical protein